MTIGVPIAGIIGSLADPIGCGPWMAAGSFGYGWWIFFKSFGTVGRILTIVCTVVVGWLLVVLVLAAAHGALGYG